MEKGEGKERERERAKINVYAKIT